MLLITRIYMRFWKRRYNEVFTLRLNHPRSDGRSDRSPNPNSLLTGKITGNFAKARVQPGFSGLIRTGLHYLTAKFPAQLSREFPNAYQGIIFEEQGILPVQAGGRD